MKFCVKDVRVWVGVSLGVALPLCSGCGAVGGAAVGAGVGSVTDVTVSPRQIALPIGQQQQYLAQSSKLIGNPKDVRPAWEILGNVGFIDANGLFIATNSGTGEVRATVKTLAGAGSVVGKATVVVPAPPPLTPQVLDASVTPASGRPGTVVTFHAAVARPANGGGVQKVEARDPKNLLSVTLVDDGHSGVDAVAGDGIYSGQFKIPANALSPELKFGVHAEDFNLPPNSSEWKWVTVTLGQTI